MATSTNIDQQCIRIKDRTASISRDTLKNAFDTIAIEINKNKLHSNPAVIQQTVTALSERSNADRSFFKFNLFTHQLWIIVRDYYLKLLRQWRNGQALDSRSNELFSQIAILFADVCRQANDNEINLLKPVIIHEPLIVELRICIKEIARIGKYLNDERIKSIDYMIRAIHYLEKGRIDIQRLPMLADLVDELVRCVCSSYFIDMFRRIDSLETLNEGETFLLDTCTNFTSWHDGGRYESTCVAIRTALLHTFTDWFQNYVLAYRQLTKITLKVIGQLCLILIQGNAKDEDKYPPNIRDDYYKMIDQIYTILNSINKSKNLDSISIAFTTVLTQCLYSLTMTNELRSYIKLKQIIPLLLDLTNINDETIQFHVYRTLAATLTEHDIKTLANPSKIANIFLKFLTNLIDDSSRVPRLENSLRSLKILVQHDEIKEELTKQNVLPLLLRCSTESKFDPIKAQLPALEILLALTFNAEAARQLKQNTKFLSNLKTMINSPNDERLHRVAENLLWKLEKEETVVAQSNALSKNNQQMEKTYNIMLSYSHSDKELCYRIHDRLVQDQLRVWIDRDQMHGQTMTAMADAIENSEVVLICMSDTYKQSAYCQSEAHYAFERRCYLIPLIMKPHYRPDGWLGILTSGKIYVDFPKLNFEIAYEKLKNEINQYRRNRSLSINSMKPIQHHKLEPPSNKAVLHAPTLQKHPSLTKNYPNYIEQWTNDHVRSFLINENFENLNPVVGTMNGHLLHETYRRCKAHWELMFQTFKNEIAEDGQQNRLTINTYIRFLDELGKYVPITSKQNDSTMPVLCTVM